MQRFLGLFLIAVGSMQVLVAVTMGIVLLAHLGTPHDFHSDTFTALGLACVLVPVVAGPLFIFLGVRLMANTQPWTGAAAGTDGRVYGYQPDQEEARQHKGREFRVRYTQPARRRASTLVVRVEAHSPEGLQFDEETWFDRMCKSLGIAREHQTGDREFDERVYVRGALDRFTEEYLSDGRKRLAILALLRAGFTQVRLTGTAAEAEWHGFSPGPDTNPDLAREAAELLFQLAERVPDFNPNRGGQPVDVGLAWAVVLWVAAALYAGLFACAFLMPPVHIGTLVWPALLTFLGAYPVFGWVSAYLLRGQSTSHDRWAALMGLGLVLLGVGSVGAVAAANAVGDPGEPTTRELVVSSKRASRGKSTSYYVSVPAWDGAGTIEFAVSREQYDLTVQGKTRLELTTGPGRLGIEWIKARRYVTPR